MAVFNETQDIDVVFGMMKKFYSKELIQNNAAGVSDESKIFPARVKGTMLIKQSSFWKVGLFDTKWVLGDFIDWYKRAMEKGLRVLMLPDVLMKRRIHGNNMSYRERHAKTDYIRIIKASLDRKRGNDPAGNALNTDDNDHG